MYNKHLDTFLIVAETGSFSKAAEALFISRTAIVQQMNLLEEHLGFQVLTRTNKGVKLTLAGNLLFERTKQIKKISSDTISECLAMQNQKQIRIGILPNLPLTLLSPICAAYHRQNPDIKITFVERNAGDYMSSFINNEFDISADYMSKLISEDGDICFTRLTKDHFDCAVSPESPLASQKKITLDDLSGKTVGLFIANLASAEDRLRSILLRKGRGITIQDIESYKKSLPLSCIFEDVVLLHYHLNAEAYSPLISIPLELGEPCPIEIGLCYKQDAGAEILRFISFAKSKFQ